MDEYRVVEVDPYSSLVIVTDAGDTYDIQYDVEIEYNHTRSTSILTAAEAEHIAEKPSKAAKAIRANTKVATWPGSRYPRLCRA